MPDAHASIARSRQLVKFITVLAVLLIVASMLAIWGLRRDAIRDTVDDNHRLGVVIAEQTTRSIQAVDFVLQGIAADIAASGVHDPASLHTAYRGYDEHVDLMNRIKELPQSGSLALIDAGGEPVNLSRRWPKPDLSYAGRSYFQHFVHAMDNGPFISEPMLDRSDIGVQTVVLSRRLTARDGTFMGIVFASIRLGYFDSLFARTGLSDGTGVTVLRGDGVVLVHYPAEIGAVGKLIPTPSRWYEIVRAGGGNYRSPGFVDQQGTRQVSVHPLAGWPIVVDVTRLESAALARWRQQAITVSIGVIFVTLGFGALLIALRRQIAVIENSQDRIHDQMDAARTSEAHFAGQSALLATTLETMDQGLIVTDATGFVVVSNRRALEMLELPAPLMESRPHFDAVTEYQDQHGEFAAIRDGGGDPFRHFESQVMYERRRPNGTMIEVRSAPLPGGGKVRTYADITARAAAEEMLGLAATQDHLTGLINRNGFYARREAELAAARRDNSELVVLCLDLDRFKAVNDTLGHAAGDQLLVMVARRMCATVRSVDVVARLGGDEFAILLPNTNLTAAEMVSRRLLDSMRMPYDIQGEVVRIGLSIGIAVFPSDGATAEDLLRNADAALYKAKAAGRDTFRAYASEDGRRQHQRMALELDFRTAVATGQFVLFYQPICDVGSRVPSAFEALVRWNHPTRGVISPAEFIPIAEQTGLIVPFGHWIIETACAEAATWALPVRIAINLSPAQFRERELLGFIRAALERSVLAPERLDLEVTEGLLLEDADDVVATMNTLRAMGIRMVLDDFGTAHSNLSYLRGFPFESVKIDQSFMRALNTDRQARALVEAILAMARALGLEVIGEGVETEEQLALLRHLQCRLVQGYLLGRPLPAEETRELIWSFAAGQGQGAGRPARELSAIA